MWTVFHSLVWEKFILFRWFSATEVTITSGIRVFTNWCQSAVPSARSLSLCSRESLLQVGSVASGEQRSVWRAVFGGPS